jgi:hypothetical protein
MMTRTTAQIVAGKASRRTLDTMLNDVLVYIESALEYDARLKRCASCGDTSNTVDSIAAGNTITYCGRCAREMEQR